MNRITCDLVIVGAGIVGASCAYQATKTFPNRSVVVIERNALPAEGASGNNSGVLHSPFQQKAGSQKANLATIGRRLAADFAKENGVPILEKGMIIAVPSSEIWRPSFWYEGATSMWELLRRGKRHNMDFHILTGIGIRALEPNIHAVSGVFIPSVSVIDSQQFVKALLSRAEKNGAQFFYENEVKEIRFERNHTILATTKMEVCAKAVINAAGLYADDIANLAFGKIYRQYPWSGEYYEVINPDKKNLVGRLVYPVVSPKCSWKGIHIGPRPGPDGKPNRLCLGPNARPMSSKTFDHDNRAPKDAFLKVVKDFGLDLCPEDIEWSHVGIRPTLSKAGEEKDFRITVDSFLPFFLNHMGISSPGISAGMGIAQYDINILFVNNIL